MRPEPPVQGALHRRGRQDAVVSLSALLLLLRLLLLLLRLLPWVLAVPAVQRLSSTR